MVLIVYKIPYRREHAWPKPSARTSKGILHTMVLIRLSQVVTSTIF